MTEARNVRLGYKASAEQFGLNTLLRFAIKAEDAGSDSVFVSNHHQPWQHTDGHAPFAPGWMAALLARTERLVVGTSVVTPTFRLHPAVVAQVFGTLGAMFPDRVILGVGTGESLNEVPPTGMVWPGLKEQSARLREAIELIRRPWSEERVSFDGVFYKTVNATIYDRPDQMVSIYIAAGGPRNAFYAGAVGDGFICTSGKGAELYLEQLLPSVASGRAQSERRSRPFDRMIELKVVRPRTGQSPGSNSPVGGPIPNRGGETFRQRSSRNGAVGGATSDRARSRWIVSRDSEAHVVTIQTYIDYGFDHWFSTRPGLIRAVSFLYMPSRSCEGCGAEASIASNSVELRAIGQKRSEREPGQLVAGRARRVHRHCHATYGPVVSIQFNVVANRTDS